MFGIHRSNPKRILIVEDDSDFSEMLEKLISQHLSRLKIKFKIDRFDNGMDAVNKLKQVGRYHYDLAILDIALPQVAGLSIAKILREEWYCIHIFMMTAHNIPFSREGSLHLRCDEFFMKHEMCLDLKGFVDKVALCLK